MISEKQYVSIKEIVSRVTRHPLLKDFDLEQAIQYTSDFIRKFGFPNMYEDKEAVVDIKDYRGLLPCDCVSIVQVKNCLTNRCMKAMTDSFYPKSGGEIRHRRPFINKPQHFSYPTSVVYGEVPYDESSFKTQGNIIHTTLRNGKVLIAYKAIPLDDDGFPLLIDNGIFLVALELYIKKQLFLVLFETGKVQSAVIQNVQQDYAWAAGQLQSELTMPSISEMESMQRMWTAMIPRTQAFKDGFKHISDQEHRRVH